MWSASETFQMRSFPFLSLSTFCDNFGVHSLVTKSNRPCLPLTLENHIPDNYGWCLSFQMLCRQSMNDIIQSARIPIFPISVNTWSSFSCSSFLHSNHSTRAFQHRPLPRVFQLIFFLHFSFFFLILKPTQMNAILYSTLLSFVLVRILIFTGAQSHFESECHILQPANRVRCSPKNDSIPMSSLRSTRTTTSFERSRVPSRPHRAPSSYRGYASRCWKHIFNLQAIKLYWLFQINQTFLFIGSHSRDL